jgi:hypothetical protein
VAEKVEVFKIFHEYEAIFCHHVHYCKQIPLIKVGIRISKQCNFIALFTSKICNMISKVSVLFAITFFAVATTFGQDKNCIGKWKLHPQPQDGLISFLTVTENNKQYFLVRTKDPKQKWKMTWNEKTKVFDVNLDGKKGTISFDGKTERLTVSASDGGKFEMTKDQ